MTNDDRAQEQRDALAGVLGDANTVAEQQQRSAGDVVDLALRMIHTTKGEVEAAANAVVRALMDGQAVPEALLGRLKGSQAEAAAWEAVHDAACWAITESGQ